MSVTTPLTPLLAALSGVIYAGLSPLPGLSVTPNVLVAGVVVVGALGGLPAATIWSVVGGLTANVLVGAPLGSYPIALLLASGTTIVGIRLAGGASLPLIAGLAAICGPAFDLVVALLTSAELARALLADLWLMAASALVTAAIALSLALAARAVRGRMAPGEGVWLDG